LCAAYCGEAIYHSTFYIFLRYHNRKDRCDQFYRLVVLQALAVRDGDYTLVHGHGVRRCDVLEYR